MEIHILITAIPERYDLRTSAFPVVLILSLIARSFRRDNINWGFVQTFGSQLPMRYATDSIDVSRRDDRTGCERVRQMEMERIGLQFSPVNATVGATLTDRFFVKNWHEAQKSSVSNLANSFWQKDRSTA